MQYTLPLAEEISIASGHVDTSPILWFQNLTSGVAILNDFSAYAQNSDLTVMIKSNMTVESRSEETAVTTLAPIDTNQSPLASGFLAGYWDGTGAMAGISGLHGGTLISASKANGDLRAKGHMHQGIRINPGDNIGIFVRDFDGQYSKVLMTLELTIDTASAIIPTVALGSDSGSEPAPLPE